MVKLLNLSQAYLYLAKKTSFFRKIKICLARHICQIQLKKEEQNVNNHFYYFRFMRDFLVSLANKY